MAIQSTFSVPGGVSEFFYAMSSVPGRSFREEAEELLARYAACCGRIPMLEDCTSLANRDAWKQPADEDAEHAALRTQDICGNFIDPNDYRISALNLSNAAAVVLYEALRQTGFTGFPCGE